VTAGSPPTAKTSANVTSSGASLLFNEPNGTLSFSITPPAGYGVASISGPVGTTFTTAPISATTTLTVKFGALEDLYFNEQIVAPHWPGLPAGTSWGVVLTPTHPYGAPGQTGTNVTTLTGGIIHFVVPKGASYKFHVTKPVQYKDAGAKKGGLTMPGAAKTLNVKFQLFASSIVFAEHGLAAHTSWSVTVVGPSPSLASQVLSSTTGSIKFGLSNGTYSYTIPPVGLDLATPASGALVVAAPHGQTVHVGFAPSHAGFGAAPVTRQASSLVGHTNLVATVSGREAA